jgi:hypothetical protein
MRLVMLLSVIFASTALAAPPDDKPSPSGGAQKKSAPKSKAASQQSLTGCVDEQDGKYVLLDDRMLGKLADLETSAASSEDVFAKHVGHKVIVKGARSSEQEGKFKVASIEDVAAVCAPAPGTNQEE